MSKNGDEPPLPAGASSWEDAIAGMIDDEFNEPTDEAQHNAILDGLGESHSPPPAEPEQIDIPVVAVDAGQTASGRAAGTTSGGFPESIIQPTPSDESNPLIILESLDSGKDSEEDEKEGNASQAQQGDSSSGPACLEVVSSGSSKGSQGSYADQVPALSGSGSTINRAEREAEEEARKRSELGSPWTLPSDNENGSNSSSSGNDDDSKSKPVIVAAPPPSGTNKSISTHSSTSGVKQISTSDSSNPSVGDLMASEFAAEEKAAKLESQTRIDRTDVSGNSSNPETLKFPADSETAQSSEHKKVSAVDDGKKNEEVESGDNDGNNKKETFLTVKTSFSTGLGEHPQESEDSADTFDTAGKSIVSNVSALVNRFAQIEEGRTSKDEDEDLDAILGVKGQPAATPSTHSVRGNEVSMLSPNSDMAGILSLKSDLTSTQHAASTMNTTAGEIGVSESVSASARSNRSISLRSSDRAFLNDLSSSSDYQSATMHSMSERGSRTMAGPSIIEPSFRSERTGQRSILAAVSEASAEDRPKTPVHPEKSVPSTDPTLLVASQKELDALIKTTEGTTAPILMNKTSEPSLAELQSQKTEDTNRSIRTLPPFDKIVNSLAKHEEQLTRPMQHAGVAETEPMTPSEHGGAALTASTAATPSGHHGESTFDSQVSGSYDSTCASATPASTRDGSSYWTESDIDSFSPRGGRSTATSPAESSYSQPFSPASRATTATDTNHTHSTYETDAESPQQTTPSISKSETEHSYTERTGTARTYTEGTATTGTERTSSTDRTGMTDTMIGGIALATDYNALGDGTEKLGENPPPSGETDFPEEGGRLWQLANQVAAKKTIVIPSAESARFAESLMARTRSRADPDAIINNSTSLDRDSDKPTMVKIGEEDDEKFIVSTALVRKRVRVVQLLLVGLLALLVSFLGTVWIQSSCHFVSASVEVGEEGQLFHLHYGVWKYSPIDSAFQGYSYCVQYDDDYTADAPFLSRWFSIAAIGLSLFSLCVLWFYLIFGRGNSCTWNLSVGAATMAGMLQFGTMIIFAGPVCQRDECSLGPAGILSLVAGVVNFVLAFEMHYNTPMALWVTELTECPSNEQPGNLMTNLEMTDFKHGAKAYVSRIVAGEPEPYKTLNQIQRDNKLPIGEVMLDRDLANNENSYKPPALIV